MAHDQSQDRFKLQLYIGLVIKELRVKLFCGGQPTKLEIVAVVDLPKAEYPLVAFSKPHDQFGESPQWIRRDDAPTAIAIAPSTRIVVKVDVTIEKKTVTLVTNPTPLLNNLIGIVKTQESGEGTMNLELENAGVSKKRAEGPPQGLMRCVMSYGVPDTDRLTERGSYRLPKDAPAPDLSVAKRFEKTDSSVLTIVHAYSGIIGDIFPNGSPPLARLIRVILARLTRFHCKVNPGITFDKNPADDMVQQLKEFLILLYNAPQLKKLRVGSESIAQINSTWYHKFEELKSQEVLLGVMKRTAMDSVPGNFRVDILTEIYMAVSLLDMCMDDHHECSYDTIITRPWFGREALMRQRKLFELRVRTIFFLLRDWYIPPDVLHRSDIVRILLRFIRDEVGLEDDKRPYTTTLAAVWGRESEDIQAEIYAEIRHCGSAEQRDHYRRAFARLAQKAGTLPVCIRLTDVEKKEALSRGGFADVYKGRWHNHDIVIKSGRAMQDAPDDPLVKKQLFLEIITWATVKHTRILEFLGWAEIKGVSSWCMISPFMAGKTTSERCDVASRSRLKLSDRKHLLKQIAEGMAYLHGEKVVHGDLRGPNVFLTTTGDVKIADFGLCVYASGVSQNYFSMRTGNTRWIAPELMNTNSVQDEGLRQERERLELENARDPDRITINRPTISSDVYSFACTCIELIDGRVPYYDQKTDPAVIRFVTIENGRPPRPRELSGTHDDTVLWEIIQRCWASVESGSLRPTFAEVYKQLGRVV